jgi:hypothetical protein
MSFKKFSDTDIKINTIRAFPSFNYFIYKGKVYINDKPVISGSLSNNILGVPDGFISLYEKNIDRKAGSSDFIKPFVTKGSNTQAFGPSAGIVMPYTLNHGQDAFGSYPLSSSITREYITSSANAHYRSLKNTLNFYGIKSEHFLVQHDNGTDAWNKDNQNLNLISLPNILYGSSVKPGSVVMRAFYTGSLVGELKDTKHNGVLYQTTGANSGSVAGVFLYELGFAVLTGSWNLTSQTVHVLSDGTAANLKWIHYGAGMNDGVTTGSAGASFASASFTLDYQGTTETQNILMLAHAKRGNVNFSNNPTFIEYGQQKVQRTSSFEYIENAERNIKNTVSSSFSNHSASFERQVFISRVAIYDDKKRLVGIATLASPYLKKEDESITFKLKLDI